MLHEHKKELTVLESWKLKIAVISAIVFPTITATGAFYGLKSEIKDNQVQVQEKISRLELQSQREFVDKDTVRDLRGDMKQMQRSIDELKEIMLKSRR